VIIGRSARSDEYIFVIESGADHCDIPIGNILTVVSSLLVRLYNYLYLYWTKSSEFKKIINISFLKIA